MTPITLESLRKTFGSAASPTVAVDDISLTIDGGQLFFLLGPSGCGKTTLLRMIAGFIDPTAGTIRFGAKDVTRTPVNRRNTGMVFQGYALWPHMTVRQNVAFGLDVRKIASKEKTRRVDDAMAMVQIGGLADRKPNQLSGGQQQRVALARALVVEPTVLLLDEPLSNLDAKLRLEMRQGIRDICRRANITAVYVTHDQEEALSMADAIAVMRDGKLMQVGRPRELYTRPASRFVAEFMGEANFLPATVATATAAAADGITLDTPAGAIRSTVFPEGLERGQAVTLAIRPEAIHLHADADAAPGRANTNTFTAHRRDTIYLGELARHLLHLQPAGDAPVVPLTASELNPAPLTKPDAPLRVSVEPGDVVVLPL